jgi:hypothetical protein
VCYQWIVDNIVIGVELLRREVTLVKDFTKQDRAYRTAYAYKSTRASSKIAKIANTHHKTIKTFLQHKPDGLHLQFNAQPVQTQGSLYCEGFCIYGICYVSSWSSQMGYLNMVSTVQSSRTGGGRLGKAAIKDKEIEC